MCRKAQSVVGAVLGMMPLSAAHHLVCKITKLPQFGYVPRMGIPNQAVQCGDGPVLIGQAADDHRLLFSHVHRRRERIKVRIGNSFATL